MTTQKFMYIDEEIQFIDDYERERKNNDLTQITSNIYQYEYQKLPKMDGENKRKRKWSTQITSQKYYKNNSPSYRHLTYKYRNDNKNKHYYRNKTNSHLESKQPSQEHETVNEDCIQNKKYNQNNTDTVNNQHFAITTIEPQKSKTPISLLNEWAMRGDGSREKKPLVVSYTLVAITGHAHKPIFTYMCRINDKTAKGEGYSKKEGKQNAAAQMWQKLFKVDSTTNNDKVITSTTITDNFEVNENDATNLTSTEGSQLTDETDANMEDEELQLPNYDMVKIAHCNMNPIGALQELSTAYKWTPPFYSFQKLRPMNKNHLQSVVYKTASYEVTCKVFHLQTSGIARTKKEAKRLAAHLMFDQISNIGEEKLNTLKSLEFINDYEIKQEENNKLQLKWNSAQYFQLYFTAAISEAVNIISDSSSSYFLFEDEKEEEIKIKNEYQKELEQSIVEFNSNASAINQLQALSRKLNFHVTYMCVNDIDQQQKTVENNTGQNEEYTVLIQVTTVPIIVAVGSAKSPYEAAEVAASSILHTFKNMLIYTSSSLIQNENNDEQVGETIMANY